MTERLDPNDCPTALFYALETALAKGDFHYAADLRDRLAQLGFKVSVRIPTRTKTAAPAAGKTGGEA